MLEGRQGEPVHRLVDEGAHGDDEVPVLVHLGDLVGGSRRLDARAEAGVIDDVVTRSPNIYAVGWRARSDSIYSFLVLSPIR